MLSVNKKLMIYLLYYFKLLIDTLYSISSKGNLILRV